MTEAIFATTARLWLLTGYNKLFTNLILLRISKVLNEAHQTGFCRMDHIQAVLRDIKHGRTHHLPPVPAFMNYEGALDSVLTRRTKSFFLSVFVGQAVDPCHKWIVGCYRNRSTNIQLLHRPLTLPIGKGIRNENITPPKLCCSGQWSRLTDTRTAFALMEKSCQISILLTSSSSFLGIPVKQSNVQ